MWIRFTENARKLVFYAQESAQKRGESSVSTEHLLLAIVAAPDCTAAKALSRLGIDSDEIQKGVDEHAPPNFEAVRPFTEGMTPCAKKMIDIALEEMTLLQSPRVGSEHLLLGLIRQDHGVASHVLGGLGVDLDKTRAVVAVLRDKDQKGKISD